MSQVMTRFDVDGLELLGRVQERRGQGVGHIGRTALAPMPERKKRPVPDMHEVLRDEADGLGRYIRRLARYSRLSNRLGESATKMVMSAERDAPRRNLDREYQVTYSGRRVSAIATPLMFLSDPEPVPRDGASSATVRDGYVFSVPRTHTFYKHVVIERFAIDERRGTRSPVDTFEVVPDYGSLEVGYHVWRKDAAAQSPRLEYPEEHYAPLLRLIAHAREQLETTNV